MKAPPSSVARELNYVYQRRIISVCQGICSDKTKLPKASAALQRLSLGQAENRLEDRIQVNKATVLTTSNCAFNLEGVKRSIIQNQSSGEKVPFF